MNLKKLFSILEFVFIVTCSTSSIASIMAGNITGKIAGAIMALFAVIAAVEWGCILFTKSGEEAAAEVIYDLME